MLVDGSTVSGIDGSLATGGAISGKVHKNGIDLNGADAITVLGGSATQAANKVLSPQP